jgi:hypothetical protein
LSSAIPNAIDPDFQVKRDGALFSSEPNNLTNTHSFKFSGLANNKAVGVNVVKGEKSSRVVVTTKRSDTTPKARHPKSAAALKTRSRLPLLLPFSLRAGLLACAFPANAYTLLLWNSAKKSRKPASSTATTVLRKHVVKGKCVGEFPFNVAQLLLSLLLSFSLLGNFHTLNHRTQFHPLIAFTFVSATHQFFGTAHQAPKPSPASPATRTTAPTCPATPSLATTP